MMTLEEAIEHCEVKEEANKKWAKQKKDAYYRGVMPSYVEQEYNDCIECAREHHQLAEWLKELRHLRNITEFIKNAPCCCACFEGENVNIIEWAEKQLRKETEE